MAYWQHLAVYIWINIGSGNGLLPDGIKSWPEQIFIFHEVQDCAHNAHCCIDLCFSCWNHLCLTLDIWDKEIICLGKCTGCLSMILAQSNGCDKKMLVCRMKWEPLIQSKLYCYTPLVMLMTWLNFGRILLENQFGKGSIIWPQPLTSPMTLTLDFQG